MNNKEFKEKLIELLFKRGAFIRQVNDVEFCTRCPYCGDSSTNPNTGHLYMRINPADNFPIMYNCFKCPASGIATADTFEELGISMDAKLKQNITRMNKSSDKFDNNAKYQNYNPKQYDFKIPEIQDLRKVDYVSNRIGYKIPSEDYQKIKIVSSLRDFIYYNDIKKITCSKDLALFLERDYVGFLTNTNCILFRDITEKNKIRWFKYKIHPVDDNNGLIYHSIAMPLDVLTPDEVTINICEGSLDILSIFYNLDQNHENVINIAMSGKYHVSILNHLISMGIAGSNITVNIWSDSDHRYKPKVKDTRLEHYQKILNKYKYIFGRINIIYNRLEKDFGYPAKSIQLEKHKL